MNLREVSQAIGGTVLAGSLDREIKGFSIDSRTLGPGDLFFALPGERVDGHRYVKQALAQGAVAAVVSDPNISQEEGYPWAGTLLLVADTLRALQQLASYRRERCGVPVIGVTGSNGKTTTKDLIYSVLLEKFPVLKTEGNLNTEIGLPLTLLRLKEWHQAAVLEMAMRGLGQIEFLCGIARPVVGVITNIGTAHYELLGSLENIAKAKGELLEALPKDGLAVLNREDSWSVFLGEKLRKKRGVRVLYYGFGRDADVRAENLVKSLEGVGFKLIYQGQKQEVSLPLPGEHNVLNSLAAAAVGCSLGMTLPEIARGLSRATISEKRLEKRRGIGGSIIINDTYNANPASMKASLGVLSSAPGRRIAVLGDMRELGPLTEAGHREIGRYIVEKGIDYLFTVGELARWIGEEARGRGMDSARIYSYSTNREAGEKLRSLLREGDVVLLKGSRIMALEEVAESLWEEERGEAP
jgi:UDP-N-acetylmuramoyl-tripeptide--D-alanyl-D-alanine ligase